MKYYGDSEIDKYLNETIFKGRKNGYFVDIGAYDGISISNTFAFEQNGWNGVCVEPMDEAYKKLIVNRKCKCVNGVVSGTNEDFCDFNQISPNSSENGSGAEMLSGIVRKIDKTSCGEKELAWVPPSDARSEQRIKDEIKKGSTLKTISVKNFSFDEVVENDVIDLLDIDTEGTELDILKSINFDKYNIGVILVENNFRENDIMKFIFSTGVFSHVACIERNELFINKGWEDLNSGIGIRGMVWE